MGDPKRYRNLDLLADGYTAEEVMALIQTTVETYQDRAMACRRAQDEPACIAWLMAALVLMETFVETRPAAEVAALHAELDILRLGIENSKLRAEQ